MTVYAKRPERENRRVLLEALETVREIRLHRQPKAGEVNRVKVLLRKAGVPIPRPRPQVVEASIAAAVARRRQENWLAESQDALESSNEFVEQHGLPLVQHRTS